MFNPREYLETIRTVIEHRGSSNEKTFALVVRNKQVLCIPKTQVQKLDTHLKVLSGHMLQHGLCEGEWNILERQIARLQKAGLLC